MNHANRDPEQIFHAARERTDPVARAAYLDGACGGDSELRVRIEAFLAADADASGFLEDARERLVEAGTMDVETSEDLPADLESDADAPVNAAPVTEGPGSIIGPYKLLQTIGEGGFGVVYMAEQEKPIRRRVALKVIKAGMDTRAVIARFEAERQALAMMDHRNIARVLDAGATATGRPYFVMELVKGIPITDYCDEAELSMRERLELFIDVCRAIQHAHHKGIIH